MKTTYYLISVVLILAGNSVSSQDTCKVLMAEISKNYEGGCKKGYAHGKGKATGTDTYDGLFRNGLPDGKGTYTWSDSSQYTGNWKEGLMHGEGTLIIKLHDRDSILSGIWAGGVYVGPKIDPPVIRQKIGVDRYNFERISDGNRFGVNIMINGMPNRQTEEFTITSTSGNQYMRGTTIMFDNVVFPVECTLRYKTWNKLHTVLNDVIFSFKITQEGDWMVTIHN